MSIEDIKKRRMEELEQQMLQQNVQRQIQEQAQLQQQVAIIEQLAKNYMSSEAIGRYGNLKSAHPEKAIQVAALLAQAVQSGQINHKIADEELKELLLRLEAPKKQFKFVRK